MVLYTTAIGMPRIPTDNSRSPIFSPGVISDGVVYFTHSDGYMYDGFINQVNNSYGNFKSKLIIVIYYLE